MPTWTTTTRTAPWTARAPRSGAASGGMTLVVEDRLDQPWEGWGGCFNELGWEALRKLPEGERSAVMKDLFDPRDGLGLSWNRLPIGANDYSVDWFSCDEHDGDLALERFSLARDRVRHIPYIRAAQAVHGAPFRLFASPWSPPTWMKAPKAYNYGTLVWTPEVRDAYARYFLKFVQGYRAEGLAIDAVHVQNEPNSDQKFPSCLWTGAKFRDFIRDHLGPVFAQAGERCAIWAGTIEREDYDAWLGTILRDPAARRFVAGAGFQWAGKGQVQRVHQAWPDLPLQQTENECGDGSNSWDHAHHVFRLLQHYVANGVRGYCYWNLVLEPGGLSTWGWRQNAMVTVDGGRAIRNPEFWVMKHGATQVKAGARRALCGGDWSADALAFRTAEGRTVVLTHNPYEEAVALTIRCAGGALAIEMEPQSFHSVVA